MHQGQAVRGGKPDDIIKATQSFVTRLLVTLGLKSKQNEGIDSDFVMNFAIFLLLASSYG